MSDSKHPRLQPPALINWPHLNEIVAGGKVAITTVKAAMNIARKVNSSVLGGPTFCACSRSWTIASPVTSVTQLPVAAIPMIYHVGEKLRQV